MKRFAVPLAAAAVAAVAVYFFVLKGSDEPASENAKPAAEVTETNKPVRALSNDSNQGGRQREMRVLIDDDPEGKLRLEGQVVDADSSPVAGAVVTVDTNPPRSVVSEEDGSYGFDKLVGRRYQLIARAEQGVAGPVTARLSEKNDPIILMLRPASSVAVTVVTSSDKKPVNGATVEVRGLEILTATTGDNGVAMIGGIAPGRHEVVAYASGYAKAHGRIRIGSSGIQIETQLELQKGAAVFGTVVDPHGKPVAGATVRYAGASQWAVRADPRLDAKQTDASGKFRFEALPSGTFRFEARHKDWAPGTSELTTLDGDSEREVIVALAAGATIRGRVVNKDGDAVGTARVRVGVVTAGWSWNAARQTFADDEGNFQIDGLPQRELELVAVHETASSETLRVDMSTAPDEREVTLILEIDGMIAGIVVDSAGEPIEGAQVTAWPDFGSRNAARIEFRLRGFPRELTDAGGKFQLRGLLAGDYNLRASPANSSGRSRTWLRERISAKTGDTDIRIELPADGTVVGKVLYKDGEPPGAFTVSVGFGSGTPMSSKDGKFELDELPPREYTVTIRGAGFDTKQIPNIVVKEGEETDIGSITVVKGRTISGTVLESSGQPVEDALVRAGKMIMGDGSTSKAQFGSPFTRGIKEVRTDPNGAFTLYGVGLGDLHIVAEHEVKGRSHAGYLPGTNQSITGLELVLAGYGSLEGSVVKAGAPADSVIVSAASQTAPNVMFNVSTGDDGKFRFDKLAPDTYKVSAMTGRRGMRGWGYYSRTVTVESDKTAKVDLTIESGEVTLTVEIKEKTGKELNFAMVRAAKGELKSDTANLLNLEIAALGDTFSTMSMSIRGNPAQIQDLAPGGYTVCVIPSPVEVSGMSDTIDYMEREGDRLAVFCQPVTVRESPSEQTMTIEVTAPDYIPPPEDA